MKHDSHYLNCIDENCEIVCCVDRRDQYRRLDALENERDETVELVRYAFEADLVYRGDIKLKVKELLAKYPKVSK